MPSVTIAIAARRAVGAVILPILLLGCARGRVSETPLAGAAARAALLNPDHPLWRERAPDVFRARLETTAGPIVIEAHRDWAPLGVDRFYQLVRAGFYDDTRFYRVRPDLIAQFGISGDPAVAAVWRTRTFADDPVKGPNARGFVSYANTGPGGRTTQLMISLSNAPALNTGEFPPIGRVIEGMDIADRLFSGYGENAGGGMRAGRQAPLFEGGNAYLDREFPRLDRLIRASIISGGG